MRARMRRRGQSVPAALGVLVCVALVLVGMHALGGGEVIYQDSLTESLVAAMVAKFVAPASGLFRALMVVASNPSIRAMDHGNPIRHRRRPALKPSLCICRGPTAHPINSTTCTFTFDTTSNAGCTPLCTDANIPDIMLVSESALESSWTAK